MIKRIFGIALMVALGGCEPEEADLGTNEMALDVDVDDEEIELRVDGGWCLNPDPSRGDYVTNRWVGGSEKVSGVETQGCVRHCPAGKWAYGVQLRTVGSQGAGDDSGVTGVVLGCRTRTGSGANESTDWTSAVASSGLSTGTWRARSTAAWNSNPIVGLSARVRERQGAGDDAGITDLKAAMYDGTVMEVDSGNYSAGSWTTTARCPTNSAICGVRHQYLPDSSNVDKRGAIAIQFECCSWP